jgi:hypothetical protein
VTVDLALQSALLLAPFPSEPVVEITADLAVELVDVHGMDAFIQSPVFSPQPLNRLLMFSALIGVASPEAPRGPAPVPRRRSPTSRAVP